MSFPEFAIDSRPGFVWFSLKFSSWAGVQLACAAGGRTVVLTREFSAVDRALLPRGVRLAQVAALEHEVGDDAMEIVARVSEAVLSCSELTEVARGLGDDIVVQLEC